MPEKRECDVCVVGAGYAGLSAARALHAEGKSVIVFEARPRIGGRVWTDRLSDGTPIDRGAAWLAPKHDAVFQLTHELGVSTYKTWVKGSHLLMDEGRARRYKGLIPKISPLAVLTIALTQWRVDRMAKRVPLDAPWTAAEAAQWDTDTVGAWMDRTRIRTKIGHDLFEMAVRGLFTGDLHDTSFLHLLFLVRGHGSINTLFSIENGSQENMVDGGAGTMADLIATSLGDAVRLNSPVRSVTQRPDHVVLEAGELSVTARYAVMTTPPALIRDIAFDPPLPDDRAELYRLAVAGPETKTLVVFEEPFWRADGFSGQSAEPGSAAEVTLDASPASGRPGVIAAFCFGPVAEKVRSLEESERRRTLLEALVQRFGPRAGSAQEIVETAWWTEPWTRGCSMAHFPPGLLTRHGRLLRQPLARVHWAGTETATTSHGAIDGAVRSGQRVAAEILDRYS